MDFRGFRHRAAAVLVAVACILAAVGPAAAQEASPSPSPSASSAASKEDDVTANLDRARRTLKYGIDSMVVSVINQARANKDKRLASDIADTIESINPDVQKAALDYFIALQDWSVRPRVDDLLDRANDLPAEVVTKALRFVQEQKALLVLRQLDLVFQLTQSAKPEIQAGAIDALAACGASGKADELIKLFKKSGTSSTVRSAIIRAFGAFATPETTKLLKDIVEDSGEEKVLRYEAITALGKQGQGSNLAIIKPSLTSKDVFERQAAIGALSGFPIDQVLPFYRQALRDEIWRNRLSVLKTVTEKKLAALEDAVMFCAEEDPEKPVRAEAVRALAAIDGAKGWALLEKLFIEPKTGDELRTAIAEQLAGKHMPASREAMVKVMDQEWDKDKSPLLEAVCRELAAAKNPAALELFDRMLAHKNFIIKIYGVRGIKETGLATRRPKLQEMLDAKPAPAPALKSSLEDALK